MCDNGYFLALKRKDNRKKVGLFFGLTSILLVIGASWAVGVGE